MVNTYLAQAVEAADHAGFYDANVKYLIADRQILAWILKYTVVEFCDMSIQEIISCIDNDIEVEARKIDPGLSNLGRITGTNTEDNIPGEGAIVYDIRFTAYHKEMEIKFLINIEAQKSTDPGKLGYHLENRIVFYLSRMISAQKYTEFFNSDFDNLKKVRSIWICIDHQENGDSMKEINLVQRTVFGESEDPKEIDLIKAVIVNIRNGENLKVSKNRLISMLENLFFIKDLRKKKQILEQEYGLEMTSELERKINIMCNWSEALMEEYKEKGLEEGMKEGVEKGMQRERTNAIQRMIKAGATKKQIISYGYEEKEYEEIIKMID